MVSAIAQSVHLSDVTYKWRPDLPPVLDISTFSVAPGERLFISGPSGSGKTTFLNLIGGVALPDTGEVTVLDSQLKGLSPAKRDAFRADHIGVIFQLFNLVPYLSLIENVLLPPSEAARAWRRFENRQGNNTFSINDKYGTRLNS
jgi:putative ABC transport system ATP-binding protein